MSVNDWYTILPAPIFKCPTSLFPICPSGNPTAFPQAFKVVVGYMAIKSSKLGVFANLTAFPSTRSVNPYPSKIHKTTGLFFIFSIPPYAFIIQNLT